MRRWLRRLKWTVLGIVVLVALAIAGAVVFVHTDYGRDVVREQIEAALHDQFPGGAKIGSLEFGVFGEIVIRDVELDTPDHKPQLVIGRATINVQRLPLVMRTVHVDRLVLDDVAVTVPVPAPDAKPEPAKPPSSAGAAVPWTIDVDTFEIHRARVTREPVEVTDLEIAGGAHLASGELTAIVVAHAKVHDQAIDLVTIARYGDGVIDVPLATIASSGVRISAFGARLAPNYQDDGAVQVEVSAEAARTLAKVELPGDAHLVLTAQHGAIAADVTLGELVARVMARADVQTRHAQGIVIVEHPEGTGIAAIDVSRAGVSGMISAFVGDVRGVIAIEGTPSGGMLAAGLRGNGVRGSIYAMVARKGDAWMITHSRVSAIVRDIDRMRGEVEASVNVRGRAYPDPDLRVEGSLDGQDAGWGNVGVSQLHVALDDVRIGAQRAGGNLLVDISDAHTASGPLGSVKLDARASYVRGGDAVLELGPHEITTAGATWAGTGGRLVIGTPRVALEGLHTASGAGAVSADATFDRVTKALHAKLSATGVALASLVPGAAGTLAAEVEIARRDERWSGGGAVHARGLVIDGNALDADADVAVAGRRVTLHASGTGAIGNAKVALDVDGPRDLTDVAAWYALDRRALREASLAIGQLSIPGTTAAVDPTGGLAPRPTGEAGVVPTPHRLAARVDGQVALGATTASGALHLRGLHLRYGDISGDVALAPAPKGELAITADAHDSGIATVAAVATVGLPVHLFDPLAWRALGRGALRSAKIQLDDVAFDPSVLGKLGVAAPYRGRVVGTIDVSQGAASVTAALAVHQLAGGPIALPIEVGVHAQLDERGLGGALTVSRGQTTLIDGTAHSIYTLGDGPPLLAPITAKLAIPQAPASQLLAIFGRTDVTAGTIDGTIDVSGTIGTPTGHAQLTAHGISVAQGLAQHKPVALTAAKLDVKWGGAAGELMLDGQEASGGTLRVTASGRPKELSSINIAIDAKHFDLAPMAALAPGPLVASAGLLDASLEVRGLDPQTGDLRGELHLANGKLPLSPTLGTVHRAKIDVTVANHQADATLTAKLGTGDITGKASLAVRGATASKLDFTLALSKVSPVAAIEPVVSADIAGHLAYGGTWTGKVAITHGTIAIPSTERDALLAVGVPADMRIGDVPPPPMTKPVRHAAPSNPWLVATVDLGPTQIDAENLRDVASGHITIDGQVVVSVGDGIGLDGSISTRRGDVEVLARAYQVDHAQVVFDGSLDPLLDINIVHDFTDVSLTAIVRGRASQPDLELSSDPSIYTPGQLLGFFLGGEPGGDPASASLDAATGAGASVLSTKVGAKFKRMLPVRVDVLSYEAGTSTTSGAVRAGVWINRKLFLQYRGHPEARPDENANEGDVEYYLPKNWLLQGVIGDRDVDGLDLLHRWRW